MVRYHHGMGTPVGRTCLNTSAPGTSAEWIARLLPAGVHPYTRTLVEYWLSIHPDPWTLPGRQHLDPLDLPPEIWPNLGLTEPLHDPFDIRYRLIGTGLVEYLGEDCTGKTVRQREVGFANRSVEQVLSHYRTVCTERRPDFASFPVKMARKGYYVEAERIHLPLAANGHDVDMILSSVVDRGVVTVAGPTTL